MKLSISLVSFNTREVLSNCLKSIEAQLHRFPYEVIVVENGSSDGSPELLKNQFPKHQAIYNQTNQYFSKANNQAFELSKGEYFLILNTDVELKDDVIDRMVDFLDTHPDVGGVGSAMYFTDGRLQRNCSKDYSYALALFNFTFLGKFFRQSSQKLNADTFYNDWDRRSSRQVEVIPDSLLMIRRSLFEGTVPYDEKFLLYFTENDLCIKIRDKGFKLYYLAEGKTLHQESQSVNKVDPSVISRIYRNDISGYFQKYFGLLWMGFLNLMIELTRVIIWICTFLKIKKFKKNLVWGIK